MPEPLSSIILTTVFKDAYTRLVTRMLQSQTDSLASIKAGISRLENAINEQNQAHFKAACLAIQDGDMADAIRSLRQGLSVDELNAPGWAVYAELHARTGNDVRAQEVYAQMLEFFGPQCDAIPNEIRDIGCDITQLPGDVNTICVPAGEHGGGLLMGVGVSQRGLLASFVGFSQTGGSGSDGFAFTQWATVSTVLYPWHQPQRPVTLQQTTVRQYDKSNPHFEKYDRFSQYPGDHGFRCSLVSVTDRFALLRDNTVIDLNSGVPVSQRPANAYKLFAPGYGVCSTLGTHFCRGLKLELSNGERIEHEKSGWWTQDLWYRRYQAEMRATIQPSSQNPSEVKSLA